MGVDGGVSRHDGIESSLRHHPFVLLPVHGYRFRRVGRGGRFDRVIVTVIIVTLLFLSRSGMTGCVYK